MRLARCELFIPFGQNTQPTLKPLENTDFTLAGNQNLRRRSEASMKIETAGTQPVFGGLCHQLIRIAGRVI
jgi:hypothetical protein